MCQPKPGPRCTNHATKSVLAAKERVQEAIASEDKNAIRSAQAKLSVALHDLDATPGGQKLLKEKLAQVNAQIDEQVASGIRRHQVDRKLQFKVYDLEERLDNGKKLLAYQRKALKRRQSGQLPTLHADYWHESRLENTWTADNGDEIRVYNNQNPFQNGNFSKCAWRLRNNQPVAMVRFFDKTNTQNPGIAVICDIEVNPDFRGGKLGIDTLRSISGKYGQLHSSGSYSGSGFRSLGEYSKLYPGAEVRVSPDTEHYEFVDWEEGRFKN